MRREDARGLWKDSPSFYKLIMPNTVAGHRYRQVRMANYGQFIAVALVFVTMVLFINYRIINSRLAEEQLTHQLTKRNYEATVADQLSKIRGLKSQEEKSKSTIESLQSQLHESSESVSRLRSQLEEKSAQYEDSLTQIKQLSDSLEGSSIKNDEFKKDIIELQYLVDNLKENATSLLDDIGEEQKEKLSLQERFSEMQQENEKLIKEKADVKALVDALNKEISQLQNEQQISNSERDILNKENGNLKAELQNMHAKAVLKGNYEENVVDGAQKAVIAAPAAKPPSDKAQDANSPLDNDPAINAPLEVPQIPADEQDSKTVVNQVPGIRMVRDADEHNQVKDLGVNGNYNQNQHVEDPEEEQDDQDGEQQIADYEEDQAVDQDVAQEEESN